MTITVAFEDTPESTRQQGDGGDIAVCSCCSILSEQHLQQPRGLERTVEVHERLCDVVPNVVSKIETKKIKRRSLWLHAALRWQLHHPLPHLVDSRK